MIYVFDGSLEGLLCAIFEWFERKPGQIILKTEQRFHPDAFAVPFEVNSEPKKADRVWKGLQGRLSADWMRRFYCTFLSEQPGAFQDLFEFACYIFSNPPGAEDNFGNEYVLRVSQTAVKVEREKHRMEAFIRFRHLADGIYYCGIDPDFNVLPLITSHFKNRYADQKWIIYDLSRHYGIHYNLENAEEIQLSLEDEMNLKGLGENKLSAEEQQCAVLWKDYFKRTNIPARKNTRLHLRHVPKRYWKYLTEKN